jgi:hypothetical protein
LAFTQRRELLSWHVGIGLDVEGIRIRWNEFGFVIEGGEGITVRWKESDLVIEGEEGIRFRWTESGFGYEWILYGVMG